MKYFFLICICILISCNIYRPLSKNDVKDVYILYKHVEGVNHVGRYELYDGTVLHWDKKNNNIRLGLNNHIDDLLKLERKDAEYLEDKLQKRKPKNYAPIKVVPLKEFGYIRTTSNKIILYGIMDTALIDLTSNKIYF